MRTCRQPWSILLFCLSEIFSSVGQSKPSVEVAGTLGESFTFLTRVPVSGNIMYEFETIGQIFDKLTKTHLKEKFKNRLQWDNQTGFFTLSDLKTNDSGLYNIESTEGETAKQLYQLYVYEKVSAPLVSNTSSNSSQTEVCMLLCSVRNVIGLKLSWFKGSTLLNQTSSSSSNITLELPLEIKTTDKHTFICVASNPVSNQSKTVKISELCLQTQDEKSENEDNKFWIISVVCAILVAAVVIMVVYIKKMKHQKQHTEDPSATEDQGEEVQYSEINHKKHTQESLCERAYEENHQLMTVYDKIRPREGGDSTSVLPEYSHRGK